MLTPRGCLAQLLGNPGIRGMGGDGRADDPARRQLDDDEDEEGSEEEVVYLCEIAGPNLIGMVLRKVPRFWFEGEVEGEVSGGR